MGKVIDYKIVTEYGAAADYREWPDGLELKVKRLIAEGYEPIGGVCASDNCFALHQAMVLRDPN